jgi:hypothetical protein
MRQQVRTAMIVFSVLFTCTVLPLHLHGQRQRPQVSSPRNPSPRGKRSDARGNAAHSLQKPLGGLQKPFMIGFGGSNPIFSMELSYDSGGLQAQSVAVGDFNKDGTPDLAVTNYCSDDTCTSGSLSVLLGNGDGTFQAAVNYSSGGTGALFVVVADVNGDGIPDLLVVNNSGEDNGDGSVGVLLGNGDGTFQAAVTYDSGGSSASSVAVGDVNRDGKPDLLVANYCISSENCGNGLMGVLLGNGNGTFQATVGYSSGAVYTESVAVADVNGDGKLDLLVGSLCTNSTSCANGVVGVLLGNGDGTFQVPVNYGSGGYAEGGYGVISVVVGDVNGDSKPDLVVANQCFSTTNCANGSVGVLLGNGNGTFQGTLSYASGALETESVALADVNGDDRLDVVVASICASGSECTSGVVDVLLGNGDGSFQAALSYGSGGYGAVSVAVSDVNGDNKPDLLVANLDWEVTFCGDAKRHTPQTGTCLNEGTVGVLLGNGNGTFQSDATYQTAASNATSVAVGDFNRDGIPDLAVADSNDSNGSVSVFLGSGGGVYQPAVTYPSVGFNTSGVAVGDFNGDGIPDLALVDEFGSEQGGDVSILLGNGDGTFGTATSYATGTFDSLSIAVGDFNGDGKLDLAVASSCDGTCGSVSILLGNGDGTFQTAQVYNSGGSQANYLVVADFNGDKQLDLAVANTCATQNGCNGGLVGVLLGNGDGTFQPAVGYPSGSFGAQSLAVGDVNGDGKLDLAVANVSGAPGNIGILLGNGDGTFQPAQTFPVDAQPFSVAIADLNGDGKPDLAFASTYLNSDGLALPDGVVGTLLGNGDGTFQGAIDYGQGFPFGYSLIATDLNGDGKPDLAVVSNINLTVFLNVVSGYKFGTTTSVISSQNPAPQFQPVTFTATVAPLGPGVPTGSVTFFDGGTSIGTGELNGGQPDQASFTTSLLSAGTHTISATFGGDTNFLTSTSTSLQEVISTVGPSITTQPQSQTINSGQTATMSVVAAGTPPLSYQWYQGASGVTTNPIAGATGTSYTTPPLTATTSYWVQVSNAEGSVNSNTDVITVLVPVMIVTQAASQTINSGQTATLSVVANGTAPLSYQWYQGASGITTNPLAGATSSSYTTPALTTTTSYWVKVSNVVGPVDSSTATITVQSLTIVTQPASQTIDSGQTAILSVVASGTAPISFQWYQGTSGNTSTPITGATNSSYTTPALTATTSYWVQVSNVVGSLNSITATINVQSLTIITQPASLTINPGQTATLAVVATGTPLPVFQWFQGVSPDTSNPIAGATASSYTTAALSSSTSYWVQVSNVVGTVNSNTATVTVAQPPTCTLAVQGTNNPLTITAVAGCIDPQGTPLTTSIQWGDGSSPATGAGGSLTATHTYAQAGTYSVAVASTDTSGLQGTTSSSTTLPTPGQGPPPITPGQTATFPATLPPGPPSVSVQFACTTVTDSQGNVQQASAIGITCTSPVIPLQSVAQNITVTISTTGPSAAALARPNIRHGSWSYAFWLPFPALFLVGVSSVRGRRLRRGSSRYLLLATLGVLLSLLVGCGGGFNLPQVTSTTTPAGSYQVTVVDNPVNTANPTGFVQTSLIVPLTVSPTT